MAVVTPTDRPKSVRNRCVIELFRGVVCVVTLPFSRFCWCRGFCHGAESDLFLFLLLTLLNILGRIKIFKKKSYRLKHRRPFLSCLQLYDLSKQPICMYNEEYISILLDNLDSLKCIRGG